MPTIAALLHYDSLSSLTYSLGAPARPPTIGWKASIQLGQPDKMRFIWTEPELLNMSVPLGAWPVAGTLRERDAQLATALRLHPTMAALRT